MSIAKRMGALCATLLLAFPLTPARADEGADLLAKHKAFAGWQFGDGAVKSLRYDETLSTKNGVSERTRTTRLGALFRSTSTNAKGLVTDAGFTGRLFWLSNENGFTRPSLGDAQKYEIASQVFFTEGATLSSGTVREPKIIDGQRYSVVRVTTPGDALDLYVDPQTGAYKRVVIDPGGSYEATIDVLAYADIAPGKKFISKWRYPDSQGTHEFSNFVLNPAVAAEDLHPPKQTAIWNFANPQPFKIKVTDKRVYVDAKVNGVAGRFILDTGAYSIALTQHFADRAHVKTLDASLASGIGGSAKTRITHADTFEIGGNTLSNVVMSSVDMDLDQDAPDGLIGFDLFGGAVVKLETDAQQMSILDPAATSVDKNTGIATTVDLTSGTPAFPMKVNGKIDINATLDSGNFYYVLFGHDLIDHYGLRMLIDNSDVGYLQSHVGLAGVGGYDLGGCGHLDSVTFGPIVYQGAPACETSSFSGHEALVGFDFFKNFDYVFDYPEATLIFIPHKS